MARMLICPLHHYWLNSWILLRNEYFTRKISQKIGLDQKAMEIESYSKFETNILLAGKNGLGGFTIHLDLVIVIPNQLHPPTFTKSLDFTSEAELTMGFTIGNHSHFAIDLDF